jgi:hypothetical protein
MFPETGIRSQEGCVSSGTTASALIAWKAKNGVKGCQWGVLLHRYCSLGLRENKVPILKIVDLVHVGGGFLINQGLG